MSEFCRLIEAASKAVQGSASIVARTEALIAGESMSDALRRGDRYSESGAEAIIVHSKDQSGEEAAKIVRSAVIQSPLICIPTAFGHIAGSTLIELGYSGVIYANGLLRAATYAMESMARSIMSGTAAPPATPFTEVLGYFNGAY
jgi:phosphoenolpyruvate phosphomutase